MGDIATDLLVAERALEKMTEIVAGMQLAQEVRPANPETDPGEAADAVHLTGEIYGKIVQLALMADLRLRKDIKRTATELNAVLASSGFNWQLVPIGNRSHPKRRT
jgi:hypothetical protein